VKKALMEKKRWNESEPKIKRKGHREHCYLTVWR
jgi:hypothetical protein